MLIARLITLVRLHRGCTCDARNTALWGHLDQCPQHHWWRRGHQARISDIIAVAELSDLIGRCAAAEITARTASLALLGDLAPDYVGGGVARRVINHLTDLHLI